MFVPAPDGGRYAIRRAALEQGRVTPERWAELRAMAEQQDTTGLGDIALLLRAESGEGYAIARGVLTPYDLPAEGTGQTAGAGDDTAGFGPTGTGFDGLRSMKLSDFAYYAWTPMHQALSPTSLTTDEARSVRRLYGPDIR
jgi:hypothetical protein